MANSLPARRASHRTTRTFNSVKWTAAHLPELRGRVVVVTGANSGIGWHTAHALAAQARARGAGLPRSGPRFCGGFADPRVRPVGRRSSRRPGRRVDVVGAGVRRPVGRTARCPDQQRRRDGATEACRAPRTASSCSSGRTTSATSSSPACCSRRCSRPATGEWSPSPRSPTTAAGRMCSTATPEPTTTRSTPTPTRSWRTCCSPTNCTGAPASTMRRSPRSPRIRACRRPGWSAIREGMGASRVVRVVGPAFVRVFTQSARGRGAVDALRRHRGGTGQRTPGRSVSARRAARSVRRAARRLAQDDRLGRQLWHVSEELTGLHYAVAGQSLDSPHEGRPRPGRRLRRAVRAADRPPRARGARVLRDRPALDAGRRHARDAADGDHPVRRAVIGLRRGRAADRPGAVPRGRTRVRHLLRLPGDDPGSRRRGRAHRRRRVRPHRRSGSPSPACCFAPRRRPAGVDEPRRRGHRPAAGIHRDGPVVRNAGRGVRGRGAQAGRRAVPSRGRRTPSTGSRSCGTSSTTSPAPVRPGPRPTSSTSRSSGSARRSAASR